MCDSDCECDRGFKTYKTSNKSKSTNYNDKLKSKNKILELKNQRDRFEEDNDELKSRNTKLENKVHALRIENNLLRSKLETAEGNFKDVMAMMKEAGINGSELGLGTNEIKLDELKLDEINENKSREG